MTNSSAHDDAGSGQPAWRRRKNRLRTEMDEGVNSLVIWTSVPWLPLYEVLADAGVSACIIDMEHSCLTMREVENIIIAAEGAGISPLVRPPQSDSLFVGRLLDAGAHGIVHPRVETAAEAERILRLHRYGPDGTRGFGGAHTRFALWPDASPPSPEFDDVEERGLGVNLKNPVYAAASEAFALNILIIETALGVKNVNEIAAVDGIDAVIFGWGDYSVQVGFDAMRCRVASAVVREVFGQKGVGCGLRTGTEEVDQFYPGCFTLLGVDSVLIANSMRQAVAAATGHSK